MFAASLWSFCTALELASADLPTQMLAITIEYLAIVTIPVAWLLFALEYTGREHWIIRKNIAMLFIIPAFTLIMVATNNFHHLFYTSVTGTVIDGLSYHIVTYGPAFWIHSIYSYLVITFAILLIVQRFVFTYTLYRVQVITILIAVLIPLFFNIALVSRAGSLALIDPTPFALVISGMVILIGMMRYQLLDIIPIAQEQVIGNMSDGVIVADMKGRILSINPSAERFLGLLPEQAIGISITTILPCSSPAFDPTAQSRPWTDQHHEMERETNGKKQYLELRCIPILSTDKEIKGRLVVIRDISDIKQAETALLLARKKLNLLSSITRHDILNQVTGQLLNIEIAKDTVKEPAVHEWLEKQENAARNIQHQIEFARDYETLGEKPPVWMSIKQIFPNLIPMMATNGITFVSQVDDIEVYADSLLESVFYNLVDNSIRHGGHVKEISIRYEKSNDGIILFYEDDGVGIPAEIKERIFHRGFGNQSGLGLFLVKEILEITGMTITESGISGKGVRFEIHVPQEHYRSVQ
jgi:PAS domain S-box-containing protein